MNKPPIPVNEMDRILKLSEFDLDYTNLQDNFKDLTKLAAKVAGTNISLINLIDSYTQWSVSNHNLDLHQMPRQDSVCQYTLLENEYFEVKDLSKDDRFKDKFYVKDDPQLKYYFGVPLKVDDQHIGALCVLDKSLKDLSPEKIELLKIIANEIVNRLNAIKVIESLKNKIENITEKQKSVVHDIRGPLSGIIGLAEIISQQGDSNKLEQVLEFISLILKSSKSILELANEILSQEVAKPKQVEQLSNNEFNQIVLKDKLERLYIPQAKSKNISLTVKTNSANEIIPFSKNKLLQIIGNLVSNAIKFTPENGFVSIVLGLLEEAEKNYLTVSVSDSGIGISAETIELILSGNNTSTEGTSGEQGFGFGLSLVKHLVDNLHGKISIHSIANKGTTFEIILPQIK